METFWAHGYATTSMRELAEKLDIHLGSLYNALGDKEEVFEKSLRLYLDSRVGPRLVTLYQAPRPHEALIDYIREICDESLTESEAYGCFVINSLLSINNINPRISGIVHEYMDMLESAMVDCIVRAEALGHIEPAFDARRCARLLIASITAMRSLKKLGQNDTYLADVRDATILMLGVKA